MGLPISILENILHNKAEAEIIKLSNGDLVTIEDLKNFWIEGHKAAEEVSKIVEENKRKSSEVGLQKDEGVERLSETTNQRKRPDLPKLREKDKDTSMPSRGRKRGKLSKSES